MKVKLTTNLKLLKERRACQDGMQTLINFLGADYPDEKPINLLTILESNGAQHCTWAFRAIEQDEKKILRLIAADIAESVLHMYEKKYPDDDRPRKAIQAARHYANAIINIRDVAASAAEDAYNAAAAAAYAAETAYESGSAYNAAFAAASAIAKKTQINKHAEIIKNYLGND